MADSPDEAAVLASLDALVLSESRVVTYRTLTATLSISTPAAKAALVSYATARADDLVVTWAAVTAGPTVQLVRAAAPGPRDVGGKPVCSAGIWGVAKKAVGGEEAGTWVAEDRARECAQSKEGYAEENSLRVDRVNVVRSETAGWNGGQRKDAGAVIRQGLGGPLGGRNAGSGPDAVAEKRKEKENARHDKIPAAFAKKDVAAEGRKGEEGNLNSVKTDADKGAVVKSEGAKMKGKSKMTAWQAKVKRELLEREKARATKTEKQVSVAKAGGKGAVRKKTAATSSRAKSNSKSNGDRATKKSAASSRKTRKIEDSDDDGEDLAEDDDEEGDEDVEPEALALQREAEEEEQAARDRDDGGRVEVDENVDDVDEKEEETVVEKDADMVIEDSSDEAEGGDAENAAEAGNGGGDGDGDVGSSRENTRKHLLGIGVASGTARKRVKRMVDENYTDAKGYIVSRRVAKWYDENGNELETEHEVEAERETAPAVTKERTPSSAPAAAKKKMDLGAKAGVDKPRAKPRTEAKPKAVLKAKAKPKPKASQPSGVAAATKKKKANGNISSFFGKK